MERVAHELVRDDFIQMIDEIISQDFCIAVVAQDWSQKTLKHWGSRWLASSKDQLLLISSPR